MPTPWAFVYALPNLLFRPNRNHQDSKFWPAEIDLNSGYVALLSGNDSEVVELMHEHEASKQILQAFRDNYGKTYTPTILAVRKSAPPELRWNGNAFNDFKNAVATCITLRARALTISGNAQFEAPWSDTFDFHPVQLNKDDVPLLWSPAQTVGLGRPEKWHFMGNPTVYRHEGRLMPDRYLYRALGGEWIRRYVRPGRDDVHSRRLFRSLEIAYLALSIPKGSGTLTEYGAQVATWISAIETLVWPINKKANFGHVSKVLSQAELPEALARRRYSIAWQNTKVKGNALQWCYMRLYDARNRFLHGEPVAVRNLFAKGTDQRTALPFLAAIIYRFVLVAYLSKRYSTTRFANTTSRLIHIDDNAVYTEALSKLLGYKGA